MLMTISFRLELAVRLALNIYPGVVGLHTIYYASATWLRHKEFSKETQRRVEYQALLAVKRTSFCF